MNMNMSSTNDDNAPPFFKVFKQVGDSLRNGGFCNTPKQPSSIMRKGKKASIAVTSEADEVEVAVETDSDGEYSQAQEKIKSVTFHDLAEPLIVPEGEEEITTATANSTIASSSKSRSAPTTDDNSQSSKSFAISTSIVAILIAALVSISSIQPHLLINLMESEPFSKLMESEQMQFIIDQVNFVVSTYDDCPMIKMTGTAIILVVFFAVASDRVKGMTSNVTVVGFVEFLWGAMVYGMIAVGVYYIYN
mmetsp:Transcript_14603/g.21771  ORF Transcript_14603/g.21771 Transcript_14603/m.21771 type:complete len:249 (+) Transcript_14603:2112-2858(+)